MRLALASMVAAAALIAAPASTGSSISQHVAKQRTFDALLRIQEGRPDQADTTHASITVGLCRRLGSGWLCHGSLHPVQFTGLETDSTCAFIVTVYPHRTHVHDSQCT